MAFNTYTDICLFRQQEEISLEKKNVINYKKKDLFKEKYLDFINNTLHKIEIQSIKHNIRGKHQPHVQERIAQENLSEIPSQKQKHSLTLIKI